MKRSISLALMAYILISSAYAQELSVTTLKYKLSKEGTKGSSLLGSKATINEDKVHTFFKYAVEKKKEPTRYFIDVASYDKNIKEIEVTTVPSSADLTTQFNLPPVTNQEVAAVNEASATANEVPTDVVEFSGIKLFAREGKLKEGDVGLLEYESTGEKIRLQDGPENYISPILVYPIDHDFSHYYNRINLNTGFFAKQTNYAIVAKGAKAFVLGVVNFRLYAGIFNTEKMDYDDNGFIQIENPFNEALSYNIDPVNKQVTLYFTTSNENPKIIAALIDMTNGAVLGEKELTSTLEGLSNIKKENLIENDDARFIAAFTNVPKDNPNWGRNTLASLKIIKLSQENSWEKEYTVEDVIGKVVSAPKETKKAKFDKKGTEGYIQQVLSVGDYLLVQGYFILGGASVRVFNNTTGSAGMRKTFIAQLNPDNGEMVAFYQFDDLEPGKKDITVGNQFYTKGAQHLPPTIFIQNDSELVVMIKTITKSAGVYKTTEGSKEITYRIVNDFGWVKLHKIDLTNKATSKAETLLDPKLNVVLDEEPIMLSNGSIFLDVVNQYRPDKKTKFMKYVIE